MWSNWIISPGIGVKIKHVWNHHLDTVSPKWTSNQKNPSLPVWEASSNQSPLFQTSGGWALQLPSTQSMVDLPRKIGSLGDKGLKNTPYIECLKLSWINPKIQTTNCHVSFIGFEGVTSPKTNGWIPKMMSRQRCRDRMSRLSSHRCCDGLEKVTPSKYGHSWYLC